MSATQPQIENRLLKEADTLSQVVYGKPYGELDERRQELMRRSAQTQLRERSEPQPGYCFQCGKRLMREDAMECGACHKGIVGIGQYYFNGRWELVI